MHKLWIVVILLLLLAACAQAGGQQPEVVESTPIAIAAQATPLPTFTPPPTIPATFTPTIKEFQGHLYAYGPGISSRFTNNIRISAAGPLYEVQPGDTLAELCEVFGISVEQLAAANNVENINHIEVGQMLVLPTN